MQNTDLKPTKKISNAERDDLSERLSVASTAVGNAERDDLSERLSVASTVVGQVVNNKQSTLGRFFGWFRIGNTLPQKRKKSLWQRFLDFFKPKTQTQQIKMLLDRNNNAFKDLRTEKDQTKQSISKINAVRHDLQAVQKRHSLFANYVSTEPVNSLLTKAQTKLSDIKLEIKKFVVDFQQKNSLLRVDNCVNQLIQSCETEKGSYELRIDSNQALFQKLATRIDSALHNLLTLDKFASVSDFYTRAQSGLRKLNMRELAANLYNPGYFAKKDITGVEYLSLVRSDMESLHALVNQMGHDYNKSVDLDSNIDSLNRVMQLDENDRATLGQYIANPAVFMQEASRLCPPQVSVKPLDFRQYNATLEKLQDVFRLAEAKFTQNIQIADINQSPSSPRLNTKVTEVQSPALSASRISRKKSAELNKSRELH